MNQSTRLLIGSLVIIFVLEAAIVPVPWQFRNNLAWAKKESKGENTVDPATNNYNQGLERLKNHDYDGAIDSFLQTVYFARNNYHPQAYMNLGLCYKAKNQDGKSIEAFKKHFEQVVGPSPDAHVELGEVYMRNNRDTEAENEFSLALVDYMGPGPRAHNALGKLLQKRQDYGTAEWHFEQALGDPPWQYAEAWMNLAENMMIQTQWGSAISQLQAMINRGKTLKDLDEPKAQLNLGIAMYAKGNHQGALEAWKQCINLAPSMAAPHLLLAQLFDSEKHVSSAINEYRRYIGLAPKEQNTDQVKARLIVLEQSIKPTEAEVAPAKPSPYMRKQVEEAEQAQQAAQQRLQEQADSLSPPSKDSGF